MAAPSTTHRSSAGRLVANPNNLSSPGTNCGGTVLGASQSVNVRVTNRIDPITAEEWGSETVSGILLGQEVLVSGVFSGWDEDAVNVTFYGSSTGSGTASISLPVSGGLLTNNSTLLWLPNDDANEPAWILRNAMLWSTEPVYFSGRTPMLVRATFLGIRNSAGNVWSCDLLANLS